MGSINSCWVVQFLAEVIRDFPKMESRSNRLSHWIWKAAAAFVLGAGISGAAWVTKQQVFLATLVEVRGARWEGGLLPTEAGSRLEAGRLRLAEGLARLVFKSGVEMTVEGPADLQLVNGGFCKLEYGGVVASVPPNAKGFTVQTAHAKVVDLGTEFGIRADREGLASVQVLKGTVELRHDKGGEPLRVGLNQIAVVNASGMTRIDGREGEFAHGQLGEDRLKIQEFTHEITTASGAGAADYVASPGTSIHFSDKLLLLKNATTSNFLRKAFLRFDLSPVAYQKLESARLTVNFDYTGYGFLSLNEDATFAVYGITDDNQDNWKPGELSWETAPAFSPDAGSVDLNSAVKLGTFVIPRGTVKGAYSVETTELAEFLRHDANHLASLVVVCESKQTRTMSVVFGFAGNNHPTLPPPTLRLRSSP